ncbi:hypothetical protein GF314_10100 [bacterium]|nr:hypothetical protein [bacterium]
MSFRRSIRTTRLVAALASLVALGWVGYGMATLLDEVAARAAAADYEGARELLATAPSDLQDDPGHALWRQRLAAEPEAAVDLARTQVRDRELTLEHRVQAALDGGSIALARGEIETAWQLLSPLLDVAPDRVPGAMYLLAGQVQHQAGNRHEARQMLASVRPGDPAFLPARTLLGRIGLEAGDNELALRYFESAVRREQAEPGPELLAGAWRALRLLGRDVEARDVARQLLAEHPASLAALEVRELQRRENEEIAAVTDSLDTDAPEVLDEVDPGQYTVQLAAFRDRSLALQFVQRWQVELPDLTIARELDDLGQPLYKVQTGRFVSHAQARTEVARLEREHGLEAFVAGGAGR